MGQLHEFKELGGPRVQIIFEPLKIGQSVINTAIKADAGLVFKG
jgi:hypothetical protein